MKRIDLRSDTVTCPTPAMREALARAEVGDDVYGEDPTVARLEAAVAERLGKQAALFVPSGTMANQIAVRMHTRPGDAVLVGRDAHVLLWEAAGAAALSGVQLQPIGGGGLFGAADVRGAIAIPDVHLPPTRLLMAENTHNASGGRVFPLEALEAACAAAREAGLRTHLDGARLWNAEIATGVPAACWATSFDSVACCFSKGLGAPVGSALCGDAAWIEAARRVRKQLGGGMRQAGILAAAALHALEHHVDRLAADHEHARLLAAGLAKLGLDVEGEPETNMVVFACADTAGFVRETRARGVWINPVAVGRFRAVTHLDVGRADVDEALGRVAAALEALGAA
ncbi:MAG: GntG family PLP-dependent aldolase [Myxococcota bacterium]|nr:GntG family PLP-dependent aldolase [Myxococcota bacterium]